MYWIIGAVAVGGVLAWLSSEESSARDSYYQSTQRLTLESKQRRLQIAHARQDYAQARDYHAQVALHFASLQTASACYDNYNHHKKMLDLFQQKREAFADRIITIKQLLPTTKGVAKKELLAELALLRQYHQEAKQAFTEVKELKMKFLDEVRLLNQQTHQLKCYIRDNCGVRGQDWYARSEQRRLARCA